jgi:hypothetical protein
MTQATLAPRTIPTAPATAPDFSPSSFAVAPPTQQSKLLATIRRSPWMLLLLAPIGAAPLYVSVETVNYGFGLALACIPVLAAAAFLLTGILTCVFFLDDETH